MILGEDSETSFEETVFNQQEPYILTLPVKEKRKSDANIVIAFIMVVGLLIALFCLGVRFYRLRKVNAAIVLNNAQELDQFINHNDKDLYALYYGTVSAVNPISSSLFNGKYMAIRKDTEEYKTDYDYDSEGRRVDRSKWMRVSTDTVKSDQLMMDGVPVSYYWMEDLPFRHVTTIDGGYNKRYQYYVLDESITGTVFIEMTDRHFVRGMKMYAGSSMSSASAEETSWVPTILTVVLTLFFSAIIKISDVLGLVR